MGRSDEVMDTEILLNCIAVRYVTTAVDITYRVRTALELVAVYSHPSWHPVQKVNFTFLGEI